MSFRLEITAGAGELRAVLSEAVDLFGSLLDAHQFRGAPAKAPAPAGQETGDLPLAVVSGTPEHAAAIAQIHAEHEARVAAESAPKRGRGRPKKEAAPAVEEPAAEVSEGDANAPAEEAPAPAVDQAAVRTKLIELLNSKGEDAPLSILRTYGASKISELKPEDYAKVVADANEALA